MEDCVNIFYNVSAGETIVTHCLEIQVAEDPLLLVAVAGGHQGRLQDQDQEGKVAELRKGSL